MKLLCFVDLHGDVNYLKKLVKRASADDVDLVICAGDLTNFEDKIRYLLRALNSIGKKVLLIQGNHESEESLKEAAGDYSNVVFFNRRAVKKGGYVFLGYGEGGFALEEPQSFRKLARKWYGEYQKENVVLVSHGPPFGTKIDRLGNRYTGSKDVRAFIERIKPKLVICGHLHETAGLKDKIGETLVINPGWEGMTVELK